VGVAGYELRGRSEALGAERVVVDLRLGRYEEARAQLRRARAGGPDLAALVERACALGAEERTPEGLEAAALRAATRGRFAEAESLVELALLRGRTDLEPVGAWLEALEAGEESGPPATLPAPWRVLRRIGTRKRRKVGTAPPRGHSYPEEEARHDPENGPCRLARLRDRLLPGACP
jgi:hypothetical protein